MDAAAARRTRPLPAPIAVAALTVTMALVAAGLFALVVRPAEPAYPPLVLPWLLLVPAFALAEVFVVHLPNARSAHTVGLREVPAVVGLALAAPAGYVAAQLLGAGLALALHQRQRGAKLAFNLAMYGLEASLAVAVYRAVLGGADPARPRGFAAALAAVLTVDLVTAALVTLVLALAEGELDGDVLVAAATSGVVAAATNACLALLVVVVLVSEPAALPMLGVVLVVLFLAYRGQLMLSHGHARLQLLYRFVGSAGRSVDLDEAAAAILVEARSLMRSEHAELVILDGAGGGVRMRLHEDGRVEHRDDLPDDPWWTRAIDGAVLLRRDGTGEPGRQALTAAGYRDGVAAALHAGHEVIGVLAVANRLFEVETYDEADRTLFETLAGHAAVALDNARLVERLRRLVAEREHQALHDPLTGLANWLGFQEQLAAVLPGTDPRDGPESDSAANVAVALLDLDDFKDVNDTLGHPAGDELLRTIAQRLSRAADGQPVARLGGDEFLLLLPAAQPDAAVRAARRILAEISGPTVTAGVPVLVTASIGVACAPGDPDAEQLLQRADVAMYAAKAAGSGVEIYDPARDPHSERRLQLVNDLQLALERGEMTVYYQPKAAADGGQVVGMEALVRWQHPSLGLVPPDEFIPLAEQVGLLGRLTRLVLDTALRQRAAWDAMGHPLDVSVNVSARDLADRDLPRDVARALAAAGTGPHALTLEITESSVMSDVDRSVAVLGDLAALGVRLSVDDFGTGYSSLAYLGRLPVHELKIDKSFLRGLSAGAGDPRTAPTLLRATVRLGRELGLTVVAEGVEDAAAWARVAELGCDLIQGYALARPAPADRVSAWLRERSRPSAVPAYPAVRVANGPGDPDGVPWSSAGGAHRPR